MYLLLLILCTSDDAIWSINCFSPSYIHIKKKERVMTTWRICNYHQQHCFASGQPLSIGSVGSIFHSFCCLAFSLWKGNYIFGSTSNHFVQLSNSGCLNFSFYFKYDISWSLYVCVLSFIVQNAFRAGFWLCGRTMYTWVVHVSNGGQDYINERG